MGGIGLANQIKELTEYSIQAGGSVAICDCAGMA